MKNIFSRPPRQKLSVFWIWGFIVALFLLVAAPHVFAADKYDSPIGATSIDEIIKKVLEIVTIVIVPLASLTMMIAAFIYLTSGGNAEKITQARQTLTWGALGIIIAFSAEFLKTVVIGVASGASAASGYAQFVNNIVRAFGQILFAMSVLMVLYASFLYITQGSDKEARGQAGKILTYSVVGLIVALLAFTLPDLLKTGIKQIIP